MKARLVNLGGRFLARRVRAVSGRSETQVVQTHKILTIVIRDTLKEPKEVTRNWCSELPTQPQIPAGVQCGLAAAAHESTWDRPQWPISLQPDEYSPARAAC